MINKNLLIFGENLKGLEFLIKEQNLNGKIDLVYIDPPFATGGNFTITNGRATTISNSSKGDIAYSDKIIGHEFVKYIKDRLILIRDLLSDKGSIYLHTDYKIGHYLKVMMDEVFGIENFRNDISRIKCNPKNFPRLGFGNIKDCILFYTKTNNAIWNEPYMPYQADDLKRLYPKIEKKTGRQYTTVPLHAPGEGKKGDKFKGMLPPEGRHWRTSTEILETWDKEGLIEWSSTGNPRKKIYADEQLGKRVQDIWEFKDPMYPTYPTEKNEDLLDFIIKTSSNSDSLVLDCFCGSGTTLKAALKNSRKFIGIDQSSLAIEAAKEKLLLNITESNNNLFESDIEIIKLL